MTRLLLFVLLVAGCAKKPSAATDDAGWHPYKNVTPAKVKQKVEDAQQKHDDIMDKKFNEAQQQQ
jgi:hypothetical protein